MKHDVSFHTEDGTELAGWFFAAAGGKPAPAIVMCHGFSATKEMHLEGFARTFNEAGMNVLVYDNRNLGDSAGTPRGEIDPIQQIRDFRDAITYVQGRDEVDAERIGIWGSSYSGGHVLVVAAQDRRVKCVVSQVPLVAGLANAQRLVRSDHWAGLRQGFAADRAARL
ncbi:acetyl xylan esterase, partial [Hoeflea sp. BAL378]|uniref:alpha/beta hydrolase n=1 Tax=Hoeflea sp. BAL378 TaxID=1547437 RepID=UPI0005147D6C